MYTQFYKLVAQPFQLTPDHRFFFGSSVHNQAMAHLTYGLSQGEGFIIITGEVGAGKTTLVGHLFSTLDSKKFIAAKVVTTQLNADDLLRMVAAAFGVGRDGDSKATLLKQLENFFVTNHKTGKRSLLVIDEAQNLSIQALEELRMLSNFQIGERAPLQSFLLGQPQFRANIASPDLEQLRQRVIASYHLGPMSAEETHSYIEHRLKTVGWANDPEFTDDAYQAVFQHTDGVPRRINTLCSRLMLYGFLEELHRFSGIEVQRVAADLARESNLGAPPPKAAVAAAAAAASAPAPAAPAAAAGLNGHGEDIDRRLNVLEDYVRRHEATIKRALAIAAEYFDRSGKFNDPR
jgi:general secretion pathway protein A